MFAASVNLSKKRVVLHISKCVCSRACIYVAASNQIVEPKKDRLEKSHEKHHQEQAK
jgi:hypothetical protein